MRIKLYVIRKLSMWIGFSAKKKVNNRKKNPVKRPYARVSLIIVYIYIESGGYANAKGSGWDPYKKVQPYPVFRFREYYYFGTFHYWMEANSDFITAPDRPKLYTFSIFFFFTVPWAMYSRIIIRYIPAAIAVTYGKRIDHNHFARHIIT